MLEQIKPCYGGAGDGRPIVCDRERPTLYRHPTEEAPDETTILNVRHLRECQGPGIKLLERINEHPGSQGLKLKKGTIMDAGIVAAPSSTTNQSTTAAKVDDLTTSEE